MSTNSNRYIVLILLALISTILFAGPIYGYQALAPELLDLICSDCDARAKLELMFTLATTIAGLVILPAGILLDRKGPRITFS